MTEHQMYLTFRKFCATRTRKDVAKLFGVNEGNLCHVLAGRRRVPEKVVSMMGYEKVYTYKKRGKK